MDRCWKRRNDDGIGKKMMEPLPIQVKMTGEEMMGTIGDEQRRGDDGRSSAREG